jgi:predicted PurR-regulated permease PerM
MTVVDSIISRLNQFSSWLFSRQWERQEILITAIVALFLLLLVLRAWRKARTRIRYMPPRYAPRTTIGIRLAHPGARHARAR